MRGSMMARLVFLGGICLFTMGSQYSCSTGDGSLNVGGGDDTFTTTLTLRDTNGRERSSFRIGQTIVFDVVVTNNTGRSQDVRQPSGQTADIFVRNQGSSNTLWYWSYNRAFVQVVTNLQFAPHDSQSMSFEWTAVRNDGMQLMPGTYEARGMYLYQQTSAPQDQDEMQSPLRTFTIVN